MSSLRQGIFQIFPLKTGIELPPAGIARGAMGTWVTRYPQYPWMPIPPMHDILRCLRDRVVSRLHAAQENLALSALRCEAPVGLRAALAPNGNRMLQYRSLRPDTAQRPAASKRMKSSVIGDRGVFTKKISP